MWLNKKRWDEDAILDGVNHSVGNYVTCDEHSKKISL